MVPRPTGVVKPTSLLLKSLRVTNSMAMSKLLIGNGSWPTLMSNQAQKLFWKSDSLPRPKLSQAQF